MRRAVPALSAAPVAARRKVLPASVLAPVLAAILTVLVLAAPAEALITGVDVASYQHPGGKPIDWVKVRAAGHRYALVKATEATTYTNPYFTADWSGAAAAGLYRGAYHYARPALPYSTALDQARYFVSKAGSMTGPLDIGAVLDLEERGGLTKSQLATWTRTWLAEVERLTGRAPMIYTGYYFWKDALGNPTDIAASHRLWLASYPNDPDSTTFRPLVPAGWSTWTFWQYRSDGTVPGIPWRVDMNRFCCDEAALAALAGSGAGAGAPFGSFDGISSAGTTISVSGWAIDPDTTDPIDVHVYVDGVWATSASAGVARPDVDAALSGFFGPDHGFQISLRSSVGTHSVCVYAIDSRAGTNPLLGCRSVTVLSDDPFGNLEVALSVYGYNYLKGWALDPSTDASIEVTAYLYSFSLGTWQKVRIDASVDRPDVAAAHGRGAAHGFVFQDLRRGVGPQFACLVATNVGDGANAFVGCAMF